MAIPHLEFRYSSIYDSKFHRKGESFPSFGEMVAKKRFYESVWKKDSAKILKTISKISGLLWQEKKIICYLVAGGNSSFSDPLTVKIWHKGKFISNAFFVDVLTHELIHCLFAENKAGSLISELLKKYKEEHKIVRSHILLRALHKEIYLTLFNKNRLARDKKMCSKRPFYARSWKIVEQEGHLKLLKDFKKKARE